MAELEPLGAGHGGTPSSPPPTCPSAPGKRPSPPEPESSGAQEVDLDWRSVATALAAFVGLVALTGLVRTAHHTITVLTVGTLLALALNPVVSATQRRLRLRRPAAVGMVLAGLMLTVVGLLALLGPPAVDQARDLSGQLPRVVRQLDELPVVGPRLARSQAPAKAQQWLERLPGRLAGDTSPILRVGRALFDGTLIAFLTFLVAVSLLLDGERLLGGLRRVLPADRREQADRIGDLAYQVVGRYVAGSVLVAVIAGIAVLMAGLALQVPLTPLVAAWVMVFDLVPQIGGAAGGIPFVLLGFSHSATTGAACAVFFVLYLQIENHLISPVVVGRTVKLSPPATMTAALFGVSAAGVVGALVAVPLLGAAKVAYHELRHPHLRPHQPQPPGSTEARAGPPS